MADAARFARHGRTQPGNRVIILKPSAESERAARAFVRQVEQLDAMPEEALRPAQAAIRATFAANFASESAGGAQWAPLAPRTVAERIRLGYPGERPILVRSGSYRRTFTEPDDPDHYGEIERRSGRTVIEEGTRDIRAGTLEFGSDRVPARPVMQPGEAGREHIGAVLDRIFDTWLEKDE